MSQDEERQRMDGLYHDIFEKDRRGAAIFEDLYKRFAARAKVHCEGGIDAVLQTYRDAAQREVIEYIVTRVNRMAGIDDSPGDES